MDTDDPREILGAVLRGELSPYMIDVDKLFEQLDQLPQKPDPCTTPEAKAARHAYAVWVVEETMDPTGREAPPRWWMDLTPENGNPPTAPLPAA